MNLAALDRLNDLSRSLKLDALLLSDVHSLAWLTGYAPAIQSGPNPFDAGPGLGWLEEGELQIITSDGDAAGFLAQGASVRTYPGFTLDHPLDPVEKQMTVLDELWHHISSRPIRIGVEFDMLAAEPYSKLLSSCPDATINKIDHDVKILRQLKTASEIVRIRSACALCDVAQAYVRNRAHAGQTEIALWAGAKGQLEIEAGERIPAYPEFVAGPRAGNVGDLPSTYQLQSGDCLRFDLVARHNAYWGDNCATVFVDEPSTQLKQIHQIVLDALKRGIDAIKPGLPAAELDHLMRDYIIAAGYPSYPHHSGHGVGTAYHEEPRIVPGNSTQLEAGMVIALEPAIYLEEIGGVRLEHTLLVTVDGHDLLTQHFHFN
ncbi:MAG: aminopeptidase P family protein [Chloroflexi bacterium]|nr:aminopeptidase P family protein [Chloroflexota bacterium]